MLDTVALMIEDHDPGARVAVLLVEEQRLRPRARRGRGPGPSLRAALGDIQLHDELVASFDLKHGVPVVVEDVTTDPSTEELRAVLVEDGVHSLWWAPVIPMEPARALGAVIAFHEDRGHVPSAHAVTAAELACSLVGIALERHTTTSELTHRSLHDDLTNLPNRTLLLDRLQTSLDRAHRSGGELAVLYVDIDRFKMVNDSLGHKRATRSSGGRRSAASGHPAAATPSPGSAPTSSSIAVRPAAAVSSDPLVADRLDEALSEPVRHRRPARSSSPSASGSPSAPRAPTAPRLLAQTPTPPWSGPSSGAQPARDVRPGHAASAAHRLKLELDLRRALERARAASSTTSRSSTCRPEDRRRRGPGALAAPRAGLAPARRVHPARRGDRARPPPRRVGARGGGPPGRASDRRPSDSPTS